MFLEQLKIESKCVQRSLCPPIRSSFQLPEEISKNTQPCYMVCNCTVRAHQCRSRIFNHGNSMKLDHPPNCVVVSPLSSFHIREECAPNPARPSIFFRVTAAVVGLSSRNEKASADCFNCQDEFDSPASCRNAGPLLPVSVIILGSIVRVPLGCINE